MSWPFSLKTDNEIVVNLSVLVGFMIVLALTTGFLYDHWLAIYHNSVGITRAQDSLFTDNRYLNMMLLAERKKELLRLAV